MARIPGWTVECYIFGLSFATKRVDILKINSIWFIELPKMVLYSGQKMQFWFSVQPILFSVYIEINVVQGYYTFYLT